MRRLRTIVICVLVLAAGFGAGRLAMRRYLLATRCAVTHTCQEFATCQQAMFECHVCGNHRLDGDGDGVPCESLCQSVQAMPSAKPNR